MHLKHKPGQTIAVNQTRVGVATDMVMEIEQQGLVVELVDEGNVFVLDVGVIAGTRNVGGTIGKAVTDGLVARIAIPQIHVLMHWHHTIQYQRAYQGRVASYHVLSQ